MSLTGTTDYRLRLQVMADKQVRVTRFAAAFVPAPEKDKIVVFPKSRSKNGVNLETIHISCKSDIYLGRYYNVLWWSDYLSIR